MKVVPSPGLEGEAHGSPFAEGEEKEQNQRGSLLSPQNHNSQIQIRSMTDQNIHSFIYKTFQKTAVPLFMLHVAPMRRKI